MSRCDLCGKFRRPGGLVWVDYQWVCPGECNERASAVLTESIEAARLRREAGS